MAHDDTNNPANDNQTDSSTKRPAERPSPQPPPRPVRGSIPEDLTSSPYSGLDSATAAMMAESFPAPRPDIVHTHKLRKLNNKGMVGVVIPAEMVFMLGWRAGDRVTISAWGVEGCVRLYRVPTRQDAE